MTELLVLLASVVFAQAPAQPGVAPTQNEANARKSMEASIERQKASVRKQTQSAVPQAGQAGWFTNPWPALVVEPLAVAPVSQVQPVEVAQPVAQCDPMPVDQVKPLIQSAASRVGIKEDLLTAVMERESAFRPCAVSPKGAQGLMQLMPATARELGVADPFNPQENISAGARLLKQLLDKYKGDVQLALGAYNAGQGAVDRQGGVPPIQETKDYITNILGKLLY